MAEDTPPPAESNGPELTPDMEQVLERYLDIQEDERRLREEKTALQNRLKQHLAHMPQKFWFPTVRGTRLKVSHSTRTVVKYDEDLLRTRLGDRYCRILSPDARKIRQHLDEVAPHLEPVLTTVGSVNRDCVRSAIEQGLVRTDEFAGAFSKVTEARVAVMRARPDDH